MSSGPYRSRAAYALLEIDKKYSLLSSQPQKTAGGVIDLMCHPGSWLQACSSNGKTFGGLRIGVDVMKTDPLPGCIFFTANISRPEIRFSLARRLVKTLKERNVPQGVGLVLMSGTTRLHDHHDQHTAILSGAVLAAHSGVLAGGGSFVAMTTNCVYTPRVVAALSTVFDKCVIERPTVFDPRSHDACIVCVGYQKGKKIAKEALSLPPRGSQPGQSTVLWHCVGCGVVRSKLCEGCVMAKQK